MSRWQETHEILIIATQGERMIGGGGVREEKMARWENLINTDTVTSCSPPTKTGRIDFHPPTRFLSTGQWGIPITVATLLAVDMDLTQQTHGTLLATLSFNNRYPSSSCLSPSINSVSPVCGFPCLSLLPPFLFLPFILSHTLTILWSTFQTTIPDFQGVSLSYRSFF